MQHDRKKENELTISKSVLFVALYLTFHITENKKKTLLALVNWLAEDKRVKKKRTVHRLNSYMSFVCICCQV